MPTYSYKCDACRTRWDVVGPMSKIPVMDACPSCDGEVYRDYSGVQISMFKPYVDIHTTGKPVELASARQRDEFHEAHNVTLDGSRFSRAAPASDPSSMVSTEEILHHIKTKGPIRSEGRIRSDVPVTYIK